MTNEELYFTANPRIVFVIDHHDAMRFYVSEFDWYDRHTAKTFDFCAKFLFYSREEFLSYISRQIQ